MPESTPSNRHNRRRLALMTAFSSQCHLVIVLIGCLIFVITTYHQCDSSSSIHLLSKKVLPVSLVQQPTSTVPSKGSLQQRQPDRSEQAENNNKKQEEWSRPALSPTRTEKSEKIVLVQRTKNTNNNLLLLPLASLGIPSRQDRKRRRSSVSSRLILSPPRDGTTPIFERFRGGALGGSNGDDVPENEEVEASAPTTSATLDKSSAESSGSTASSSFEETYNYYDSTDIDAADIGSSLSSTMLMNEPPLIGLREDLAISGSPQLVVLGDILDEDDAYDDDEEEDAYDDDDDDDEEVEEGFFGSFSFVARAVSERWGKTWAFLLRREESSKVANEDETSKVAPTSTSSSSWTKQKLQFLDRIALLASSLLRRESDAQLDRDNIGFNLTEITPQSDLGRPGRHFCIVTTAALPWFTGTAVNPLLRAAYLHRQTQEINEYDGHVYVTLVIPWLELEADQQVLFGKVLFDDPSQQEAYIRNWLATAAGMPDVAYELPLVFYPARYHSSLRSIFAMGDLLQYISQHYDSRSDANANQTMSMDGESLLTRNSHNGTTPARSSSIASKMDVCILEEPEHCNWFRAPGDGWTKRFHYVIGIVHTNYKEYASSHYSGLWTAPALEMISSAMVRAYCHKVIKLSDALQTYAPEKESTSNVHGVRMEFLQDEVNGSSDDTVATTQQISSSESSPPVTRVYFIGKLLWAKGLDIMLDLQNYYRQCTGEYFAIDIYGSGPDQPDIKRAFHGRRRNITRTATASRNRGGRKPKGRRRQMKRDKERKRNKKKDVSSTSLRSASSGTPLHARAKEQIAKLTKYTAEAVVDQIPKSLAELRRHAIPATFPGRVDHAELKNTNYTIFVNPSLSEVLCTTTAEALAMGKFVIIPVHPSNAFFMKFPNCLAYRNKLEFVANLRWALTHDPEPLSQELRREFTWEAATDRLMQQSAITQQEAMQRERLGLTKLDERIAWFHNEIGKGATGDVLRKLFGAGPVSEQVRYQQQKNAQRHREADSSVDATEDDSGIEDADDGLSAKFRCSSFAEAIREAFTDIASFGIQ